MTNSFVTLKFTKREENKSEHRKIFSMSSQKLQLLYHKLQTPKKLNLLM